MQYFLKEECEAEYKDLSDKIDQLSSDYQKRTGSLQRDSSWCKSQSKRSGSQERKDYRPPPRSGSRESIQTDYNRQRSGSFDYSATRHSKGRHHGELWFNYVGCLPLLYRTIYFCYLEFCSMQTLLIFQIIIVTLDTLVIVSLQLGNVRA